MRVLDRYLAQTLLHSTAVVFGVLLALFSFITFVEVFGDIGQARFQFGDALRYVLLSLPRQIYEIFPMAALLGTLLGLSSLAVDAELTAMRAAGVSVLRLAVGVLKAALWMVAAVVLIGEFVAPPATNAAERGRATALETSVRQQKDFGLWVRDAGHFVHIGEMLPDLSLLRVDLYEFDAAGALRRQVYADTGRYRDGAWHFDGARVSEVDGVRVHATRVPEFTWQSLLAPEMVAVFSVRPEGLSSFHLYQYIDHLDRNKQDTRRFRLAFWYKMFAPLTILTMVVLAIPFVFTDRRSGGVGSRLFLGVGLSFGFYVASRGFGYFGLLYGIPPLLGVLLPTGLFLAAGTLMLRRVR